MSELEARNILAPHEVLLADVVRGAWKRWQGIAPKLARPTGRGRANMVYDLMVEEARVTFDGHEELEVFDRKDRFLLLVRGADLALRFKKLDGDHLPRTYPTQTALAFDGGGVLPGIPGQARLTIGYMINDSGTELTDVMVVGTKHWGKLAWAYSIFDAATKQVTQLPLGGPSSPAPRERVRIRNPHSIANQIAVNEDDS